ncbi:unnamed protein product [Brachionus calyciflorus]|uniref:Uncharacterized protein n=1 Tax=Brachionus calyciflorus TaxID=104777 RepID=A0A814DCZ1_9BILA|nr:unnamed protein product [Brachionus calyciflorus]
MSPTQLVLILTLASVYLAEYTTFYNQPEYRYYYGYHPYKSYRSLNDLIKKKITILDPIQESVNLIFKRDDLDFVNCSFNSANMNLECTGPLSELSCSSSFDFLNLENVYFETHGLGKVSMNDDGYIQTGFVKYTINPFEKNSTNSTHVIYDYSIPVYGYGLDIYVNTTQQQTSGNKQEAKMLTQKEYVCFNSLISLLNESKFFYNMNVVSNLVNKALIDLIY